MYWGAWETGGGGRGLARDARGTPGRAVRGWPGDVLGEAPKKGARGQLGVTFLANPSATSRPTSANYFTKVVTSVACRSEGC
jgi:hypothetical protein